MLAFKKAHRSKIFTAFLKVSRLPLVYTHPVSVEGSIADYQLEMLRGTPAPCGRRKTINGRFKVFAGVRA